MPFIYSDDVRTDIATRLTGGQSLPAIATALDISLKTVYRLKKTFLKDAVPKNKTPKQTISREQLLAVADIMSTTPKTTLKELRLKTKSSSLKKKRLIKALFIDVCNN